MKHEDKIYKQAVIRAKDDMPETKDELNSLIAYYYNYISERL